MATIADLATATTVGSGDYLVISDSGTDKKLDAMRVPWTDQTATHTEAIVVPALRSSGSNTIDDSSIISFQPNKTMAVSGNYAGMLLIWSRFANTGSRSGIVAFRVGTSPHCVLLADGGVLAVSTTIVTVPAATLNKLTITAASDGYIYIINRTGAQINIGYQVLG